MAGLAHMVAAVVSIAGGGGGASASKVPLAGSRKVLAITAANNKPGTPTETIAIRQL